MVIVNNENFTPGILSGKTIHCNRLFSVYQDFIPRDIEALSGLCNFFICHLSGSTTRSGFYGDLYQSVAWKKISSRYAIWMDDNHGWR